MKVWIRVGLEIELGLMLSVGSEMGVIKFYTPMGKPKTLTRTLTLPLILNPNPHKTVLGWLCITYPDCGSDS